MQDAQEVMDMLEKAVDDAKHTTINKEEEEEVNEKISYDVDTVNRNTLEAEMQKYVESDKNDNNKNNKNSEKKEDIEKDNNNDNNEGIQIYADLDLNLNESNEGSECNSEKEREVHYAMHPDSESECTEFDSISERDIDEWMQRKEERWKHKIKSYSD